MISPRILLIQPPIEDFYTTPIRLYPLGLLYVARTLELLGCTVTVLDCLTPLRRKHIALPPSLHYLQPFMRNHSFPFRGYFRFGVAEDIILSQIMEYKPDMIGISAQFTAYFETVGRLAAVLKKSLKIPLFVGGNHATVFGKETGERTRDIDFVLSGPGEESLPRFIHSLDAKRGNDPAPLDWTTIEPAHHLLCKEHYTMGRKPYISLTASRGCPYGCDFCNVHLMFGKKIRYRSVDAVLKEMRWNYSSKKVKIFNFEDDNLAYDRRWFLDFLHALIHDPVLKDIELTAMNGMCYPTLDEELLITMKHAGFRRLNLSFVTRDAGLRTRYHRPGEGNAIEHIITEAQSVGLFITVYVIIGLPGQTFGEAKETIDYLLSMKVLVGPSVFYLAPGSPLYGQMKAPPRVLSDWNLYRSSAFAVETEHFSRERLLSLFNYARERNLARKGIAPRTL